MHHNTGSQSHRSSRVVVDDDRSNINDRHLDHEVEIDLLYFTPCIETRRELSNNDPPIGKAVMCRGLTLDESQVWITQDE